MPRTTYWAAQPPAQLGSDIARKLTEYADDSLAKQIRTRSARAYSYYYGLEAQGVHATSQVLRAGEEGELAKVRVNHSRPLVNTLLNLIVAPKVVWEAKATNVDYESMKQIELAKAVLEYYFVEQGISAKAALALEEALAVGVGEGFLLLDWDDFAGDDHSVDPMTGEVQKTGDVTVTNVPAWDVFRDTTCGSYQSLSWVIVRVPKNRYDLMVRFPKAADLIEAATDDQRYPTTGSGRSPQESDLVSCYYFYHKRTPAMPQGRQSLLLQDGTILQDGVLDWEEIPLYRIAAGEMTGTPYGYTSYLDILGIQELMDSLHTSIATNQTALATQCIVAPAGAEFSPEDISGGMKVVYVPPMSQPPVALQLTKSPPEVFTHLDRLKSDQELLVGLNSVVRGQPQSGDQSGTALAHLSAQALQQASTIQSNYLSCIQRLGNGLFDVVRRRLSVEKKVGLVGKSSAFLITEDSYSGDSFDRIQRVTVVIGNPLSQTTSGRDIIAKDYLALKFIKTPEQLQQVHDTGRLEPLTQSLSHELLLIKAENEQMARGESPQVLVLDDHVLHAREHRALLANPQARANPAIVQAVLQHIDEHERLYTSAPPLTLMMVGQEPPPMMGPPPGAPGPNGPPPPGPNAPGPTPPKPKMPAGNPQVGKPPKLPEEPKNAATGQKYDPVTGGGQIPPPAP